MAVLVLGGAGYIGSHTAYELIDSGADVVIADNLETGHREAVHPQARFYQGDIRDRAFLDSLFEQATEVGNVRLVSASFTGTDAKSLRSMGERVRDKAPRMVAVLSTVVDGKGTICVSCGKEAVEAGVHAGNLVKEIAKLAGGSGGGRADNAMAGVKEIFKIDEAIAQVPSIIARMIAH